jgi:hypothetical protein
MKDLSASATPAHLIEPYAKRKARLAPARKASIAREAARLAAIYARLRLPVPMRLTPLPLPEPEPVFIPYQLKRERGATGRRDSARATAIRGSRLGRPPSSARIRALASGRPMPARPFRIAIRGSRIVRRLRKVAAGSQTR